MPKVSIGLPVYNGENFIEESIDSLLNQTFDDFELIICDNSSTDSTKDICKNFVAQDCRVSYYSNDKNYGAAYNYNKTFKLSTGRYFKWMSHDDICAPTFLERCINVLDQESFVVLSYPKTAIIDENGKIISYHEDNLHLHSLAPHLRLRNFFRKPAGCNAVFGLMRSQILSKTKLIGPFESSDHNLLLELSLLGKFWEVPEHLFFRRYHPQMSRRICTLSSDYARWFDSSYAGLNRLPVIKLLHELVKSIQNSPISFTEKFLCFVELIRATFILSSKALIWIKARADQNRMY